MRLSVSLVTYAPDPALLERTLRSLALASRNAVSAGLLAETHVYLVDNGPAGAPVAAAANAWTGLGPLEVLSGHGNVGFGRGNNLALARESSSQFHLVLNPDVEIDPQALVEALAVLRNHPEVGVVAPATFGPDGARQYLCKRVPSVWVLFLRGFAPASMQRQHAAELDAYEMRDVIGDTLVKDIPLTSGCFLLARTAVLRAVGGFDPAYFLYFEDYDLSLRVGRRAKIAYAPRARIVHHGGEASRKGLRHVAWFVGSAWRFFARHGWRIA